MLTRRSLLAGTAALAVGCGRAKPPVTAPVQLNMAAYLGFMTVPIRGMGCYEKAYEDVAAALDRDTENEFGPTRGRYRLTMKFVEDYFPNASWDSEPDDTFDTIAALLDELDADLVTVWPELAQWLGRRGLLVPLNQFNGADDESLEQVFFPIALDRYRADGALYALPVSVSPLLLYYHAGHFRRQGVPPVDASWDWEDLVESATRLTTYQEDGSVRRWGLLAHDYVRGDGIWWALWQNGADALDADTLRCRLQEPAAVEALQFVHDLMHTHGVSPPAVGMDLWEMTERIPPAMQYGYAHQYMDPAIYRMAALPQGKEFVVPVHDGFGIGIATRTPRTQAALTALQGLVHALQEHVEMPATREGVAALRGYQTTLLPEERAAIERSLEHGRPLLQSSLQGIAVTVALESLARGDGVASAVNQACATVEKYQNEAAAAAEALPLRPNPWGRCESAR